MRILAVCKKNNGYITIEASIIIPLAILCFASAVYLGFVLHQRAAIQSAADDAAEAGAKAWAAGICRLEPGKPVIGDFEKTKLYRRIYDADKDERLEYIKKYALTAASRNELIRPVKSEAEVTVKDYIVYRKLEVRIEKQYDYPLGNFMRLFGGSGRFTITARSTAAIDEPAELIRTTDFLIDIEKELEEKFPEIRELREKTWDVLNNIKRNIEKFLEE